MQWPETGSLLTFFSGYIEHFAHPAEPLFSMVPLAAILVLTGTFEQIYSLEIFALWIFIALTAIALMRLRKKEPELFRPYRAWGYPWTAIIVALVATAIAANLWLLRPLRSSIGVAVILVGLPFFSYWSRSRSGNTTNKNDVVKAL